MHTPTQPYLYIVKKGRRRRRRKEGRRKKKKKEGEGEDEEEKEKSSFLGTISRMCSVSFTVCYCPVSPVRRTWLDKGMG